MEKLNAIKDWCSRVAHSAVDLCNAATSGSLDPSSFQSMSEALCRNGREMNMYIKNNTLFYEERCKEADINDTLVRIGTLIQGLTEKLANKCKDVYNGKAGADSLTDTKNQLSTEIKNAIWTAQHLYTPESV